MTEISTAGPTSAPSSAKSIVGRPRGGKPVGTSPTTFTPAPGKFSSQVTKVVPTIAKTGPTRAIVAASPGSNPSLDTSTRAMPLRTQNRKDSAATPMISVGQFKFGSSCQIEVSTSGKVCPCAVTPRICFSWLAAIRMPEAVMNPAITGCDRKFATTPNRKMPMPSKIRPDSSARTAAAAVYSLSVCSSNGASAEAVISDTTATGPTANARLVPNSA